MTEREDRIDFLARLSGLEVSDERFRIERFQGKTEIHIPGDCYWTWVDVNDHARLMTKSSDGYALCVLTINFPAEWKQIGTIGVDAGLCWIGDPCYVLPTDSEERKVEEISDWSAFCDKMGVDRE